MPRGTPSTSSAPSKCFWRGWSRRGHWKFILQMLDRVHFFVQLNYSGRLSFSQPISKYRNQTTTLIPFLQAINHFCNFIPSYFIENFGFLIEHTTYVVEWGRVPWECRCSSWGSGLMHPLPPLLDVPQNMSCTILSILRPCLYTFHTPVEYTPEDTHVCRARSWVYLRPCPWSCWLSPGGYQLRGVIQKIFLYSIHYWYFYTFSQQCKKK